MAEFIDTKNNIAVMVVSCDNYSDIWSSFFHLFNRFWPDCPFPVYLISNQKKCDIPSVISITVGEDVSWSDNLQLALDQAKEEFVLMWIDDLFLLNKVNTEALLRICSEFIKIQGNYIRLNPTIKADTSFNQYFGLASPGTIYRTSTVLSLWRKDVLRSLLKKGESAWDFEIFGTVRSDKYAGFYATWRNNFKVLNCIIKGKWHRYAVKKMVTLGIDIHSDKRKIMTLREHLTTQFLWLRSRLFVLVPSKYRRQLKDIILRGKYIYKVK